MARASHAPTLAKLDFKESLIQSGKRETTDALLKRIKTLHEKLKELEQDLTDTRSLDAVKKPLLNQLILHHKDRGVKAYAACCIADLLRLYAPDAPFTETQLRDIFQFFLTQITLNLRATTSSARPLQVSRNKSNDASQMESQQTQLSQRVTDIPYYAQYHHLIESLATIKSVVLVCDVPDSEQLMEGYFTGFLEIVRPDMNKTVIRNLRDILVAIIEEAPSIPSGIMDAIISQFENFAKKPDVLSFQLTVDVCNQVADKLKRPIFAHFSDIQIAHGRDPSPNDLKILSESHDLLLTMYKSCPDLLLNVVPLLEENLKIADEVPIRQLSVRTLGALFGQRSGAEDPAKRFPSAWRAWIGRKVDKALAVRLAWVNGTRRVLINHPEVRRELESNLVDRIEDSDEKVRAAICIVIGSLDYETALHHITPPTLQAVGNRMKDKKAPVRAEAASALAKLWNLAYSEIEAGNTEAIEQFAWIPEMMILCTSGREATPEARIQITSIFKSSILPLPTDTEDEQAWVDRLLLVASSLNDQAFMILRGITNLPRFSKGKLPYTALVQFCEEYNGGIIGDGAQDAKAKLNYVIDVISRSSFADYEKAKRDLHSFAAANEARLFKLYKTCVDPQSNLAAIVKARNEFLRRVQQSHEDLLETLTSLVDLSAWNIVNQSSIPPLIKRIQKPESEASATAAVKLLAVIAKDGAPMFKNHARQLAVAVMDKKNERLVEVALQALAAVCKLYPEVAPNERRTVERAVAVALTGTPRQAKFAARFLARSKEPELCEELLQSMIDGFDDVTDDLRLTYLRGLAELALSANAAFEAKSEEIMKFVMNDVIVAPSPSAEDDGEGWIEEDKLEPLDRAKLIGLRVLTHRALGFARIKDAEIVLRPIINLLSSVLEHDGMINENTGESGYVRSHLRLRASKCLLKLANVKAFDKEITQPGAFELVAGTVQDPTFQVRNLFLKKLFAVLPDQRLLPRWNLLPVMSAMDPENENVILGRQIMHHNIKGCVNLSQSEKIDRIEMPLARLLHLLAHHPDLSWHQPTEGDDRAEGFVEARNVKDIAKFIELFLDVVANRDNIGLIYAIALGIKGLRDRRSEDSKPLWTLAELSQFIIKNKADRYAWPIPIYPGHLKWPKEIFHHSENPEEKKKVQRHQFLSEEVRNWAKDLGKKNVMPSALKRADPASSPARKRAKSTRKTPKKKRRVEESDDEDDDEEDEDEEEESGGEDSGEDSDETAVEDDGEVVMGRGGRRGAKTKAKRAVAGKKGKKKKVEKKESDVEMEGSDSDLTEEE